MHSVPDKPRLKVLFVEDSEVDVELALLALRDELDVEHRRVEEEAHMRRALVEFEPDVILSDYSMPKFNGMDALKLAAESRPDVPFIFISGTIGEERAIQSVQNGAIDYILKSNLKRLGVAVQRALDDAEVRRSANELKYVNAQLAAILEDTAEFVATCDSGGNLKFINSAGRELVGLSAKASGHSNLLELMPDWAATAVRDTVLPTVLKDGRWEGECAFRTIEEGRGIPIWLTVSAHAGVDGELEHFSLVARDLSERKEFEKQLAFLANHDALTGLPNRSLIEDRVAQASAYLRRGDRPFALLIVDLDGFRMITDGYGPSIADAMLQQVAVRLRQATRDGDTVARLGGDTFVILATNLVSPEDSMNVIRKVQDATADAYILNGVEIHATVSIGASVFPRDGTTFAELLRNADTAMHRAKAKGHGGLEYYDATMTEDVSDHIALAVALRGALDRGEIELHYQPLVAIRDHGTVGFEALMRWRHPDRGMVSPAQFIPIAERTRQILELGTWALGEACRQLVKWNSHLPKAKMSVNVSAGQFLDQGFVESIEQTLADSGLEPSRLVLELTESVLVENVAEVIKVFERVQSLGVQVAIDDFGTGYSSLSYLSRLPIDCLKIDRSFVQQHAEDAYDAEIVRAIISLGVALDMRIVAEGVETEEQLEFLKRYRCDEAQGYYFAKPLPAEAVVEFLEVGDE